jgi:hypothetical protein
MSQQSSEFFNLLEAALKDQKFNLALCPSNDNPSRSLTCSYISTLQLKSLIETVIDNPITQSFFNQVSTLVFKDCILTEHSFTLNVIDKLLFLLHTRINSLSSKLTFQEGDIAHNLDLNDVLNSLYKSLEENKDAFSLTTFTENSLSITIQIPTLEAEQQLNDEIYQDLDLSIDDEHELKRTLSTTFINEVAKCFKTISIGDNAFNMSSVPFSERIKRIEMLPASLVQKAIEYTEKYKKIIDECLTIKGQKIIVDGRLFSNH